MGLAASQARLLSITSRMSDTELRSQLINNAKMRLTTDSAKVSDEYIAALNQTQMMFTNFDRAGNERYQNLTFNALTAYSSYNNQYGLVNNNGQLLVSDLDANNFVASGQNVNNFLHLYGLEQTTTYWDALAANPLFGDMGVGYYDDFGEWQRFDATVEDLKAMYEGEIDSHGIDHYGLEASYNSVEFETYSNLVATYKSRQTDYNQKIRVAKNKYLEEVLAEPVHVNGLMSAPFQHIMTHFLNLTALMTTAYTDSNSASYSSLTVNYFEYGNNQGQCFNVEPDATTVAGLNGPSVLPYAGGGGDEHDVIKNYMRIFYAYINELNLGNGLAPSSTSAGINYYGSFDSDQMAPVYWKPQSYFEDNDDFYSALNQNLELISIWANAYNHGTHEGIYDNCRCGEDWVYFENPEPGKCYSFVCVDNTDNSHAFGLCATNPEGAYIYDGQTINQDRLNSGAGGFIWGGSLINDDGRSYDFRDFVNGYEGGFAHVEGGNDAIVVDTHFLGSWEGGYTYEPLYIRRKHPGEENDVYTVPGNPTFVYTWESKGDRYFNEATPVLLDCDSNATGIAFKYYKMPVRDEAMLVALNNVLTILKDSANYLDEAKIRTLGTTEAREADQAFQEYQAAATQLAKFIWGGPDGANGAAVAADMFGSSINEKYYENLDDPTWVLSPNPDSDSIHFNPYYTQYPTSIGEWFDVTQDGANDYVNYQVIRDITLLECMLAQYGEPKYTWIDVNNPEENADAKVRWYTNLFNRMKQGYETIPPGLENSSDWIQFAFESGLVHMEQVNSYDQWVSLMYSNCTGITESTVDVDITLAEAKYKREMAKIEAKDKRYDMELKTLDTEHETLKQEYEQIKKVIQKNIDRNMKMFQMG